MAYPVKICPVYDKEVMGLAYAGETLSPAGLAKYTVGDRVILVSRMMVFSKLASKGGLAYTFRMVRIDLATMGEAYWRKEFPASPPTPAYWSQPRRLLVYANPRNLGREVRYDCAPDPDSQLCLWGK